MDVFEAIEARRSSRALKPEQIEAAGSIAVDCL